MTRRRAFFYVQHLLGIGHLRRAATIANALASGGAEVTLVSGGYPVRGLPLRDVRFVQLPPAASPDATFKKIVDEHGRPVDDDWKRRRRDLLLDAWREANPHAVVIELFPFGRRQMRFELDPLLEAVAREPRRPIVVSSVRDILGGGQKNPSRQAEMLETFERHFDQLMVHGDPSVILFEATFKHVDKIADRLHYTGYVVEGEGPRSTEQDRDATPQEPEVVVSAGGGAVGRRLLETAIFARSMSSLSHLRWRLLHGVNAPESEFGRFTELAGSLGDGRVIVERARDDFQRVLAGCTVSISQCGYNTMTDVLRARARSVVVPFAGGGETEQTVRAQALSRQGLAEMIPEDSLTPESLAAAVDRAVAGVRPSAGRVDLEGASRSAELIAGWMRGSAW